MSFLRFAATTLLILLAGAAVASTPDETNYARSIESSDVTIFGSYALQAKLGPGNRKCCNAVAMTKDLAGIRWAVLGAADDDNNSQRGAAYVFSLLPGAMEWHQEARLVADDGQPNDHFGSSVAIDGDTIVVGAPYHANDAGGTQGAVYVFRHHSTFNTWDKEGPTLSIAGGGQFGTSVALWSGTLAVGAPSLGGNGYVLLYDRSGDTWNQSGALTAGTACGDFGDSLSLRGAHLAVGAKGCSPYVGFVTWAIRDSSGWSIVAADYSDSSPAFGTSVKILDDDGHVAIGDPSDNYGAGAVHIVHFEPTGGWSDDQTLLIPPSDSPSDDAFGALLDFANNTLVVGTPASGNLYFYQTHLGDDLNAATFQYMLAGTAPSEPGYGRGLAMDSGILLTSGYAQNATAYAFDGTNWTDPVTIVPAGKGEQFGASVAIAEQTALASAPYGNVSDYDGAWFDFLFRGGAWTHYYATGQVNALVDYDAFVSCQPVALSNRLGFLGEPGFDGHKGRVSGLPLPTPSHAGDGFGCALAVSESTAANLAGSTVVVGAPGMYLSKGGAYVFVYNGTDWVQQAQLFATDRANGDNFGLSVAIAGDRIVIGAPFKANNEGAAYVFERSGTTWTQTKKLVASDGTTEDEFGASVAVSDTAVLVGAPNKAFSGSGRGAAYFFKGRATTWNAEGEFHGFADGYYGSAVALSRNTAVIGFPGLAGVQVLSHRASGWWVAGGFASVDTLGRFGNAVDIDDTNTIIVGAMNEGDGHAYIFNTDVIFQDGFDP